MKKYSVNVSNVGTIDCTSKRAAVKMYNDYVKTSKGGLGRAGAEDVWLAVDGEPEREFYYYDYIITVQDRKCQRIEKTLVEEKAILNRLVCEQEARI